jgi:hypothetical protein
MICPLAKFVQAPPDAVSDAPLDTAVGQDGALDGKPDAAWESGPDVTLDGIPDGESVLDGKFDDVQGDEPDVIPDDGRFGHGTTDSDVKDAHTIQYDLVTKLTSNVSEGAKTLTVGSTDNLASGDHILIIDLQGSDAVGRWEMKAVTSALGTTIAIEGETLNAYPSSDNVRVIKVPEYRNVTVGAMGVLRALPWNAGTTEETGVLVFFANGALAVAGTIDMVGRGYHGGPWLPINAGVGCASSGEGYVGVSAASSPNGYFGGGGGCCSEGNHSYGGGGGHVNAGADATFPENGQTPGKGGSAFPNAGTLLRAQLGGAGGGGCGGGGYDPGVPTQYGGNGGGIVLIFARSVAPITGSISAIATDPTGGGGSGAGGTIIIGTDTQGLPTDKLLARSSDQNGAGFVGVYQP